MGAPFIDCELAAADNLGHISEPLPANTVLILSHHNFEATLTKSELRSKEAEMRSKGAGIAKIAMTAQDISDSWTMLELLQQRAGAASSPQASPALLDATKYIATTLDNLESGPTTIMQAAHSVSQCPC
jgi:3-dehydroquinate dehydratase type I